MWLEESLMAIKEIEPPVNAKMSKYFQRKHSIEVHNFWIQDRKCACPYCNRGSIPVQKKEIEEDMKKYDRG